MEAFRQQLEKMDQTASQKTDTEDEKDETVSTNEIILFMIVKKCYIFIAIVLTVEI